MIASGSHLRIRWYIMRDGQRFQVWVSYPHTARKNATIEDTVSTLDDAYKFVGEYISKYGDQV